MKRLQSSLERSLRRETRLSRLQRRAQRRNLTVGEYLRDVILGDMGDPGRHSKGAPAHPPAERRARPTHIKKTRRKAKARHRTKHQHRRTTGGLSGSSHDRRIERRKLKK
jgi:hypothetical protein